MDEFSAVMKARELINKVGPNTIPVPIKPYLEQLGAVLRVAYDLGANEPGYTVEIKGKHYIRVNGNDSEERQRFTACHEAAHVALELPSEHAELPWWSYAKRSPNEIFCDVFAAELLLPYKLFKPLVDKSDISLATVDGLAKDFVASTMATGSRYATFASTPSAFVLSERGKVRYASRSTALREARAPGFLRVCRCRRDQCQSGFALAARVTGRKKSGPIFGLLIGSAGARCLEDARHLAQWDQTVALIRFEDEEVPAPEQDRRKREEEETGLAELDGVLPWPGRKRRK